MASIMQRLEQGTYQVPVDEVVDAILSRPFGADFRSIAAPTIRPDECPESDDCE